MRFVLIALALAGAAACRSTTGEVSFPPWHDAVAPALALAAQDGKPILLQVRRPFDIGSVTVREWLMTSPELAPLLAQYHCVSTSTEDPALKGMDLPPAAAMILGPDGAGRALIRHAATRAQFVERFKETAAQPRSTDELKAASLQAPADSDLALDAADALLVAGRLPEALEVLAAAAKAAPEVKEIQVRHAYALAMRPIWAAALFPQAANAFQQFAEGRMPLNAVLAASSALAMAARLELDGDAQKSVLDALAVLNGLAEAQAAALAEHGKRGAEAKDAPAPKPPEAFGNACAAIVEAGKMHGKVLRDRGLVALREFIDRGEATGETRVEALQTYVRMMIYQQDKEKESIAFVKALVNHVVVGQESLELLPILVEAVIQLDLEQEHQLLAEKAGSDAANGYRAAAANLDLADRAVERGDVAQAMRHWDTVEKTAAGESEALGRAARAARSLIDGSASPNRSRWARRQALDAVVLVPDVGAFLAAISRWTEDDFFPVLFQDDLYAPRFIDAWKPKAIYLAPATGTTAVDLASARHAVLMSWLAGDAAAAPASVTAADLAARLKDLDETPLGAVFVRFTDGEALGGVALAAGRFQGLEELACDKDSRPVLTPDEVKALERQLRSGLARYGLPGSDDRWAAITLAAAIPYRTTAAEFPGWGNAAATDDCLGRRDDSTRYAAVSRLLGDAPRSVYQAMCSLFLVPDKALFFNNYGTDPKTIWGSYRTSVAAEQFAKRMPSDEVHTPDNLIAKWRERVTPWNPYSLIGLNSSGGGTGWSIGGGDGTTDDFPIGVPAAIHVTHSGSAADPYNPDTLAGRAIWGGAYWYFGSTAEPFLAAFQPPRNYAPRILAGAPFAATFRLRTDDRFWSPWRLMIVGDPLFCLRDKPAERQDYVPAAAEKMLAAVPFRADLAALRKGEYDAVIQAFLAVDVERRKDLATRVHARYAAAARLEQAIAQGDAEAMADGLAWLAATGPQGDFFQRQLAAALAKAREAQGEAATKLLADLVDRAEMAAFRSWVLAEQVRCRLDQLVAQENWTTEDAAAALAAFQEILASKAPDAVCQNVFRQVQAAYLAKAEGATLAAFGDQARALKTATESQAKIIATVLAEAEKDQSYRKDWLFLGPFADPAAGAWEKVGPEAAAAAPDFKTTFQDGGRTLAWTPRFGPNDRGLVDFTAFMKPSENVYAYAAAELEIKADAETIFWIGSDDGVTAWLDGKQIHRADVMRAAVRDQDRVPVTLTAGVHSIVLRIDQGGGGWGFFFRISGPDGKAEPAGMAWRRPVATQ